MPRNIPRVWRNIPSRYNLIGVKCTTCSASYFPPRKVCPNCRRKGKMVETPMPRSGVIFSFSQVHSSPEGFELETPYFLALIELDNGVKILTQIVDSDADKVKLGAKVEMVFRRIATGSTEDAITYGYKFKVV